MSLCQLLVMSLLQLLVMSLFQLLLLSLFLLPVMSLPLLLAMILFLYSSNSTESIGSIYVLYIMSLYLPSINESISVS